MTDTPTPLAPVSAIVADAIPNRIHAWDDPASKVQFMETVAKGKDWTTSIYGPLQAPDGGKSELRSLAASLEKKGYVCRVSRDELNGRDKLVIHHLGDESGLIANVHALGFTSGLKRTLTHLDGSLSAMMKHSKDLYHYVSSDKARLLSGFYLVGDVFYAFQSKGNSRKAAKFDNELLKTASALRPHAGETLTKKMDQAEIKQTLEQNAHHFRLGDKLQDLSGYFATAQSLIYLYYARDTGEVAVGHLQHDVGKALKKGLDPLDEHNWHHRRHPPGPLGKLDEVIRRHPIEGGAYTQMAGQAFMTAGGAMRMMNANRFLSHHPGAQHQAMVTGGLEVGRGLSSIAAWELLKMDPKHHDDHPSWANPERWMQAVTENPQKASSIVNTGASLIGLASANQHKNWIRSTAEVNYLIGDATMFMLNKSDYGGKEGAVNLGAEAASKLITDSNLVFGWEEEGNFVQRLSSYIGRRIVEDTTPEKDFPNHKAYLEGIEKKVQKTVPELGLAITQHLANRGRKLGTLAHYAATIVKEFPKEQQEAVITSLSEALAKTKAVYVSPKEFQLMIRGQTANLHTIDPATSQHPTLASLTEKISDLLLCLPGYDVGASASRLHDAVQPFCLTQHTDAGILQKNLRDFASRGDAIPPAHQLQLAASSRAASHSMA